MATLENLDWARAIEKEAAELIARSLSPAQVVVAFATDEISHYSRTRSLYLDVRHRIMEVNGIAYGKPDWADMGKRIRTALLVKEPSAKSERVERRLMHARAGQARKSKARRI